MPDLIPVILSGGAGTRLWPLSRRQVPKQLAALFDERSLLQGTAARAAAIPGAAEPVIVCGVEHVDAIRAQLAAIDITPRAVIAEPVGRNTAPAVAAAAHTVSAADTLIVLPADHLIRDTAAFVAAASAAVEVAGAGRLVTFGVTPHRPETGYGYLRHGDPIEGHAAARALAGFTEKPDPATAERYVTEGLAWNSGMFVFRADRYLDELADMRPDIERAVAEVVAQSRQEGDLIALDPERFAETPAESIDYAVMEHTTNGAVVPLDAGWTDIGSWHALWEISDRDADDNVVEGVSYTLDVSGSYVRAGGRPVVVIGLDDVVVVDTGDAVLVAARDRSQDVKEMVAEMDRDGRPEISEPPPA